MKSGFSDESRFKRQMGSPVVLLTGPTATGKSSIAFEFARTRPKLEIINADSLLFYRGANIGTAKPSRSELETVPHHLIDLRDPGERLSAAEFRTLALNAVQEIESRGRRALVVGGSGFFLKALRHGIWDAPPSDPKVRASLEILSTAALFKELEIADAPSAQKIGPNDRYRLVRALEIVHLSGKRPSDLRAQENPQPDPRFPLWVIDREDFELDRRIEARTEAMLEAGLIEEYEFLARNHGETFVLESVGYFQVGQFLMGIPPAGRKLRPGLPGLRDEIQLSTRQLVKSQRTWFKRQPESRTFLLNRDADRLFADLAELYPEC